MTITECKKILDTLEGKIIENYPNARSNQNTMIYYCTLGYYRFLGGKENIRKRVVKNGLTDHMPTDKAKYWYEEHADAYSTIAAMYFCLLKSKNKHKRLFAIDKQSYSYCVLLDFIKEIKRVFKDKSREIDNISPRSLERIHNNCDDNYINPMTEATNIMKEIIPNEWYTEIVCVDNKFIYDTCNYIIGGK